MREYPVLSLDRSAWPGLGSKCAYLALPSSKAGPHAVFAPCQTSGNERGPESPCQTAGEAEAADGQYAEERIGHQVLDQDGKGQQRQYDNEVVNGRGVPVGNGALAQIYRFEVQCCQQQVEYCREAEIVEKKCRKEGEAIGGDGGDDGACEEKSTRQEACRKSSLARTMARKSIGRTQGAIEIAAFPAEHERTIILHQSAAE